MDINTVDACGKIRKHCKNLYFFFPRIILILLGEQRESALGSKSASGYGPRGDHICGEPNPLRQGCGAAALFELQVKIILNSRASQLNCGTKNNTDTQEEIRFKNRKKNFKTAERKGLKNTQQVTKNAVTTLREFCKFEVFGEQNWSSEYVHFHLQTVQ